MQELSSAKSGLPMGRGADMDSELILKASLIMKEAKTAVIAILEEDGFPGKAVFWVNSIQKELDLRDSSL